MTNPFRERIWFVKGFIQKYLVQIGISLVVTITVALLGTFFLSKIPEKILRKILEKIDPEDIKNGAYTTLISDMKVSMLKNEGVGLAANQIGKDLAIFVIAPYLAKEHDVPEVYFNPEITEYSKELDELKKMIK